MSIKEDLSKKILDLKQKRRYHSKQIENIDTILIGLKEELRKLESNNKIILYDEDDL